MTCIGVVQASANNIQITMLSTTASSVRRQLMSRGCVQRVHTNRVNFRVPARRCLGRNTVVSNQSTALHLGLLSDVQYADKPDKVNSRGVTVGYRLTAAKLARAVRKMCAAICD